MQIKTTMRYHFTQVSMTITKQSTNKVAPEMVEKRESSYTFGGDVFAATTTENSMGGTSKI